MSSGAARRIVIEVVCATPDRQTLIELEVSEGTTVAQAVSISDICSTHPEIDLSGIKTGIFGRLVAPETVLRQGDRVEIYRPLQADPKEIRRRRAGSRSRRAGKS